MSGRSLLFVPGHRLELLAKVPRWQPDAVIVDLEDAHGIARAYVERMGTGSFLTFAGRPVWVEQAGAEPTVVFAHAGAESALSNRS